MGIEIDYRESDRIKNEFVVKKVEHTVLPLPEGDFRNTNITFIAERKTWKDYLASIQNNHLITQLSRMRSKNPTTPLYVIFEGDYDAMLDRIVREPYYKRVLAFRYKIAHAFGAQFIQSWSTRDTVDIVVQLDHYAPVDVKIPFESIYVKQNSDMRVRVPMACPGIGQSQSERLLKEAGSLYDAVCMVEDYPERVMKLKGWGKKSVENFRKFIYDNKPFLRKIDRERAEKKGSDQKDQIANKKRRQKYAKMNAIYNRNARGG